MKKNKLIGDKAFYKKVFSVAIPIMIQNAVTNFVSLLDNIMVGKVGTDAMSGVSIANQLLYVYNLCIFGAVSAASIFGSQYYGKRDFEGMKHTMRLREYICAALCVIGIVVFLIFREPLINAYLQGEEGMSNPAAAFACSNDYLLIMLIGLVPFTLSQCYAGIMKEVEDTFVPMVASAVAVAVNLLFNYILIFGKFGAPELGAVGAAIATVISRVVECLIVVIWSHTHKKRYQYVVGLYSSLKVPIGLVKNIAIKGTPLIVNETLWAAGMAMLSRCYSLRSVDVVPSINIEATISNLFYVVFIALGCAIAVIVGPLLGAGEMEEAKDTAGKMMLFTVISCFVCGALLAVLAPLFPRMYNTDESVRDLATRFIIVCACCMPIYGFVHAAYFTLRSGGKTIITFLFDSAFVWVVNVPCALALVYFTDLNIVTLFLIVQLTDLIKCVVGYIMYKKGIWLNQIVE